MEGIPYNPHPGDTIDFGLPRPEQHREDIGGGGGIGVGQQGEGNHQQGQLHRGQVDVNGGAGNDLGHYGQLQQQPPPQQLGNARVFGNNGIGFGLGGSQHPQLHYQQLQLQHLGAQQHQQQGQFANWNGIPPLFPPYHLNPHSHSLPMHHVPFVGHPNYPGGPTEKPQVGAKRGRPRKEKVVQEAKRVSVGEGYDPQGPSWSMMIGNHVPASARHQIPSGPVQQPISMTPTGNPGASDQAAQNQMLPNSQPIQLTPNFQQPRSVASNMMFQQGQPQSLTPFDSAPPNNVQQDEFQVLQAGLLSPIPPEQHQQAPRDQMMDNVVKNDQTAAQVKKDANSQPIQLTPNFQQPRSVASKMMFQQGPPQTIAPFNYAPPNNVQQDEFQMLQAGLLSPIPPEQHQQAPTKQTMDDVVKKGQTAAQVKKDEAAKDAQIADLLRQAHEDKQKAASFDKAVLETKTLVNEAEARIKENDWAIRKNQKKEEGLREDFKKNEVPIKVMNNLIDNYLVERHQDVHQAQQTLPLAVAIAVAAESPEVLVPAGNASLRHSESSSSTGSPSNGVGSLPTNATLPQLVGGQATIGATSREPISVKDAGTGMEYQDASTQVKLADLEPVEPVEQEVQPEGQPDLLNDIILANAPWFQQMLDQNFGARGNNFGEGVGDEAWDHLDGHEVLDEEFEELGDLIDLVDGNDNEVRFQLDQEELMMEADEDDQHDHPQEGLDAHVEEPAQHDANDERAMEVDDSAEEQHRRVFEAAVRRKMDLFPPEDQEAEFVKRIGVALDTERLAMFLFDDSTPSDIPQTKKKVYRSANSLYGAFFPAQVTENAKWNDLRPDAKKKWTELKGFIGELQQRQQEENLIIIV